MEHINENRFEDWKGSKNLTFIDREDGQHLVECDGKRYNYSDFEKLFVGNGLKNATGKQIRILIAEGLVKPVNHKILNEMRYDWGKIDPRTGLPKVKEPRPEESIELMTRMPYRSGWIVLLQNRINLNSVGNIYDKRKVWFDATDKTVSSDESKEDAVHFRVCRLSNGARPAGWLTCDEYTKLTRRPC